MNYVRIIQPSYPQSMHPSAPPPLPLAGCTVVELGHSVAGPFAGQILSDLGARVLKVEKPKGDDARHWGPPFVDGASATFQALNRNKQSISLDLRKPDELAALQAFIVDHADAVIQNMRPGQVDELGLDADTLRGRAPRLVYCNLGAFGAAGPLADRPGYDPLMQAFSGIMSVVGEPGGAPVRVGPSIVDMGCGMWGALGIVSLLLRRATTGVGGVVDASLLETAIGWMGLFCAQYQASGELPRKNGSGQTGIVPYRAFATADGDVVVSAGNDTLFARLCRMLDHADWLDDPRFVSNPLRVEHAAVLNPLLEDCFRAQTTAVWMERLEKAGIPCAPVQNVAQMLAHAQTRAIGILQQVPGSSIDLVGLPLRFDGQRPVPRSAPPPIGTPGDLHLLTEDW